MRGFRLQAEMSGAAVFFRLKPEATNARTYNVSRTDPAKRIHWQLEVGN